MTDAQFQKKLDQLARANAAHSRILKVCRKEYIRRYGRCPNENDDDMWIDSFETGGEVPNYRTVAEVEHGAIDYAGLTRVAK